MRSSISNGQGIDRYIPPHLRRMFYQQSQHPYARHNGKDPYGFSTNGLVLYLPLWALKGSSFNSVDVLKHGCVATGALWRPNGRWFDGADDKLDLGNNLNLDLNGTDFTQIYWIYFDTIDGNTHHGIMYQKDGGVDAQYCYWNKAEDIYWRGMDGAEVTVVQYVKEWVPVAQTWYFLSLQHNGQTWEIKVDVATLGTVTDADDIDAGADENVIGQGAGLKLLGRIGECWWYRRGLPDAELTAHKNSTIWRYQ